MNFSLELNFDFSTLKSKKDANFFVSNSKSLIKSFLEEANRDMIRRDLTLIKNNSKEISEKIAHILSFIQSKQNLRFKCSIDIETLLRAIEKFESHPLITGESFPIEFIEHINLDLGAKVIARVDDDIHPEHLLDEEDLKRYKKFLMLQFLIEGTLYFDSDSYKFHIDLELEPAVEKSLLFCFIAGNFEYLLSRASRLNFSFFLKGKENESILELELKEFPIRYFLLGTELEKIQIALDFLLPNSSKEERQQFSELFQSLIEIFNSTDAEGKPKSQQHL